MFALVAVCSLFTQIRTRNAELEHIIDGTCWPMTYIRPYNSFPNHCGTGYQKQGVLCFPDCDLNYHGAGPMCIRNKNDTGGKLFYGRGFGSFVTCPSDHPGFMGVCYKDCGEGYKRNGPTCWAKCGGMFPYKCGKISNLHKVLDVLLVKDIVN
jgi:hypothetical protein